MRPVIWLCGRSMLCVQWQGKGMSGVLLSGCMHKQKSQSSTDMCLMHAQPSAV